MSDRERVVDLLVVGSGTAPQERWQAFVDVAANAFGGCCPGAGATIGQGLVFGYIAACEVTADAGVLANPSRARGHDQ